MHNCVYLYICSGVFIVYDQLFPGPTYAWLLLHIPADFALCIGALYKYFLNDVVDDCPSPRPTLPSPQDPRNPVTFLSLDFIFVSIWISLLSINISITGVRSSEDRPPLGFHMCVNSNFFALYRDFHRRSPVTLLCFLSLDAAFLGVLAAVWTMAFLASS